MPSADVAVRIARALGVTAEYLITGYEQKEPNLPPFSSEPRVILKNLETLNKRDRKIVLNLIKSLREMEEQEKKA